MVEGPFAFSGCLKTDYLISPRQPWAKLRLRRRQITWLSLARYFRKHRLRWCLDATPLPCARYSYHAFITDRDGETLELEADHRRHAEVENAIRDLKYGVGLNHMPSARFAANGAWLAVQVMAHNLDRWTARIGLGERTVITKTLRRRVFARWDGSPARRAASLCISPGAGPWEIQFSRALARLQAIPFPA